MNPCDHCRIRTNCDFLSGMCRLTPREIAQTPHLITIEASVRKRKTELQRLYRSPDYVPRPRQKRDRTGYFARYYQINRDKKLAAANERYRDRKGQKTTIHRQRSSS